jgi:hypothetical protein
MYVALAELAAPLRYDEETPLLEEDSWLMAQLLVQ